MENGRRVWKQYETLYVDGEDFNEIGRAFERECHVKKADLGNGTITLMKQRPAGGQRDSTVIKEVEPDKRDKGYAWHTAIGLQAVDGGITFEEANALLQVYYEENPTHNASGRTEGDYEVP